MRVSRTLFNKTKYIAFLILLIGVGCLGAIFLNRYPFRTSFAMAVALPVCGTWDITLMPSAYTAVSAVSGDDVWFAGWNKFSRWDGSRLITMPGPDWDDNTTAIEIRDLA